MAGDDRDRVKQASDIVRVVGETIELRARGREYVGLCPFHDDHTPSMAVVPAKQIFHCFACGAGGDVFTYVMRYHRMEFPEALRFLADKAGLELTPLSKGGGERSVRRSTLVEANAFAQSFFRTILAHPEHGLAARELVERRGISRGMVEAFALGASPDRWDGLLQTIGAKRLDTGPFEEVGLLKARDTGGHYDALRNRLIFPIFDQAGRVIAFGGRRVDDQDDPKYLNSPESDLFNKSATLYGIHAAARPIQKSRVAIVTEGYTDVIACHQAGVDNAVATLGTALTREHARLLRRLCHTVVLLFDGDEAGLRAADRAVEVFFSEAIDVKIATLAGVTDAKDPDELLKREGGRELFDRAIADASDILDFRLEATRRRLSVAGVSQFEQAYEDEVRTLAGLGLSRAKPVRRQRIVQRLVELTGLRDTEIVRALGQAGPSVRVGDRVASGPAAGVGGAGERGVGAAEAGEGGAQALDAVDRAVGAILRDASLLLGVDEPFSQRARGLTRVVLDALLAGVSPETNDPLGDVLAELEGNESATAHAIRLERAVERETEGDLERARQVFQDVARNAGPSVPGGPLKDRLAGMRATLDARTGQGTRLPRPGSGVRNGPGFGSEG